MTADVKEMIKRLERIANGLDQSAVYTVAREAIASLSRQQEEIELLAFEREKFSRGFAKERERAERAESERAMQVRDDLRCGRRQTAEESAYQAGRSPCCLMATLKWLQCCNREADARISPRERALAQSYHDLFPPNEK